MADHIAQYTDFSIERPLAVDVQDVWRLKLGQFLGNKNVAEEDITTVLHPFTRVIAISIITAGEWRRLDGKISKDIDFEALHKGVLDRLSATAGEPLYLQTLPARTVPDTNQRGRSYLAVGSNPVIKKERGMALEAVKEGLGIQKFPEGVWLPETFMHAGLFIARAKNTKQRKIMGALTRTVSQDRLLGETVRVEAIESAEAAN